MPARWRILVGCLLLALGCQAAQNTGANRPWQLRVRVGGEQYGGLLLNTLGHVMAPLGPGANAMWQAEYEGEVYPLRVVSEERNYGVILLKLERARPFPAAAPLAERAAPIGSSFTLAGYDETGAPLAAPVSAPQREGVTRYRIEAPGRVPVTGAALVDRDGLVHGLLLPPVPGQPQRTVLAAGTMRERAALKDIPLGDVKPPPGFRLTFADGTVRTAATRQLAFSHLQEPRNQLQQARARQDWEVHSGFRINPISPPAADQQQAYVGSLHGVIYCLDLAAMARTWFEPRPLPMFSAPSVGPSHLVYAYGDLSMKAWTEADPLLLTLFDLVVKRDKYAMLDRGFVSCVDRQTGQLRWEYPDKPIQEATRFVNEVRIAGDRVGIAGMGILGVLKLADGKPDWLAESPRKDTTPFYYTLAGVTQDRLWSYRVKTRMVGKGIRMDPYRLELEGAPSEVQCYDLAGRGQPRWTTPIGAERRRPALNLALILSADGKSCFGASGGTVFAVDAETGAIRWQKTGIFPAHFAGGMVLGEGILFATGSDARLVALDPNSGEKLWDFTSPTGRPLCTPLAHDGLVYAGSLDGKLYALEGRTGRSAWTLETSSAICGQPVVQGRKLYFTTDDGSLTEFALP